MPLDNSTKEGHRRKSFAIKVTLRKKTLGERQQALPGESNHNIPPKHTVYALREGR